MAEKGGKQGPGQWLRGTLKEAQGGDSLTLAAAPAKPAPRPPPEKRLGLAGITCPRLYVPPPAPPRALRRPKKNRARPPAMGRRVAVARRRAPPPGPPPAAPASPRWSRQR